MRIYQKATIFAYKDIDDNLSEEEKENLIDEFQGDLNLDLDNLGYGGNPDYRFIHDTETLTEEEMRKNESLAYRMINH